MIKHAHLKGRWLFVAASTLSAAVAQGNGPVSAPAETPDYAPERRVVVAQNSDLEERLSRVEKRLEKAEEDQLPWDKYISEFGGRVQFDETFNLDADEELEQVVGDGDLEDGAEFRRVRLFVEGPIASWLDYKLQLDFAGGVEFKDVYFTVHDLGALPEIKIGNFKEPIVMDELTSSKYITFMARSMLSDFFSPEYNTGIQLSKHFANDRLNVWAGVFNSDFDEEGAESLTGTAGQYNYTFRVTSPVVYLDEGRTLVHVGGSYHRRADEDGNTLEFGLEPEVHKTDDFVGGTINGVENADVFNAELAAVFGPVHFQGEYALMQVNRDGGEDPDLDSFYVQSGLFLTGEHRPYDKGDGTFERVKPLRPFEGLGTGPGAWEIAARYSHLDMSEAGELEAGGFDPDFGTVEEATAEVDVITVGLNWYPVSHARWMLNYIYTDQDELGNAQYIATRFQVDF